jgi:hypothetical protein
MYETSSNIIKPLDNDEQRLDDIMSSASVKLQPHIDWSSEHEDILVEWADKAMCYRWLHGKSNIKYTSMNAWFTIPVIIMSTLTGTANFAQERIDIAYRSYATMGIGAINLLAGILTTIQQYLKVGELNEAHRSSAISWGKFYRNIKVELTKKPLERSPVIQMLKLSKEEFDRLMETSPPISEKIINEFKRSFVGSSIDTVRKPEICGSLETTAKSVFKNTIIELRMKRPSSFQGPTKQELELKKQRQAIEDFIKHFEKERKRLPSNEEIISNVETALTYDIIQDILSNYQPSLVKIVENDSIDETLEV